MEDFDNEYLLDGREETLKSLGNHIAKALIKLAKKEPLEGYEVDDSEDYLVGELARCLTLQNLYLDREEYEKCAIMKLRIIIINKKLGLDLTGSIDELDEED
tara:strand:- start:89 stop:394 length:306 start_codon:yes stop_codon:yes gene_type:complete